MTDEEILVRYHEIMLRKLTTEKPPLPEPKSSGIIGNYKNCDCCGGSGTVRCSLTGWFIDYHYQDGHEQCGPYSKEEAVKRYLSHTDKTSNATLIGPDGMIYTLEKQ